MHDLEDEPGVVVEPAHEPEVDDHERLVGGRQAVDRGAQLGAGCAEFLGVLGQQAHVSARAQQAHDAVDLAEREAGFGEQVLDGDELAALQRAVRGGDGVVVDPCAAQDGLAQAGVADEQPGLAEAERGEALRDDPEDLAVTAGALDAEELHAGWLISRERPWSCGTGR